MAQNVITRTLFRSFILRIPGKPLSIGQRHRQNGLLHCEFATFGNNSNAFSRIYSAQQFRRLTVISVSDKFARGGVTTEHSSRFGLNTSLNHSNTLSTIGTSSRAVGAVHRDISSEVHSASAILSTQYRNFATMSKGSESPLKIIIFLGSVRKVRMGERVGKFVTRAVEACGMKPILFDPASEATPFTLLRQPLQFMKNPEEEAPQWLRDAAVQIQNADGFIIVTPEYNCALPPGLTNMLDHFPPKIFRHRPCGLISYSMGPYGGMRALVSARPFASEFGMITVPSNIAIPTVNEQFDVDGNCLADRVANNIDKVVKEVEWYGRTIRDAETKPPVF